MKLQTIFHFYDFVIFDSLKTYSSTIPWLTLETFATSGRQAHCHLCDHLESLVHPSFSCHNVKLFLAQSLHLIETSIHQEINIIPIQY
jgi:hypothetical protein